MCMIQHCCPFSYYFFVCLRVCKFPCVFSCRTFSQWLPGPIHTGEYLPETWHSSRDSVSDRKCHGKLCYDSGSAAKRKSCELHMGAEPPSPSVAATSGPSGPAGNERIIQFVADEQEGKGRGQRRHRHTILTLLRRAKQALLRCAVAEVLGCTCVFGDPVEGTCQRVVWWDGKGESSCHGSNSSCFNAVGGGRFVTSQSKGGQLPCPSECIAFISDLECLYSPF